MLPNIRDDAIHALLGLAQGNLITLNCSTTFYGGPDNILHMIFNVFVSSVDWIIFNFKHNPSPIVLNRGIILYSWWSYTIFWVLLCLIRHTWPVNARTAIT
jgi:hypothetical protein